MHARRVALSGRASHASTRTCGGAAGLWSLICKLLLGCSRRGGGGGHPMHSRRGSCESARSLQLMDGQPVPSAVSPPVYRNCPPLHRRPCPRSTSQPCRGEAGIIDPGLDAAWGARTLTVGGGRRISGNGFGLPYACFALLFAFFSLFLFGTGRHDGLFISRGLCVLARSPPRLRECRMHGRTVVLAWGSSGGSGTYNALLWCIGDWPRGLAPCSSSKAAVWHAPSLGAAAPRSMWS